MDETENFNPKQSSAEFIPTEADWINLEKQVLELLNLQKQLEQKYNYEKVRTVSSYQDRAKYGLTALYGNLHPDSVVVYHQDRMLVFSLTINETYKHGRII